MKFKECLKLIQSDQVREFGRKTDFFRIWFDSFKNPCFAFLFWTRICQYLWINKKSKFLLLFCRLRKRHYSLLTGIQIPMTVKIGKGLFLPHYSNIVVACDVEIGDNCAIHQGVTIGRIFAGKKCGCPKLGNNIIIFAGAKVLGNIKIGNNSIIGANAVVTDDVPDNCVVAGIPAKIISNDSTHVINKEWRDGYYYKTCKE